MQLVGILKARWKVCWKAKSTCSQRWFQCTCSLWCLQTFGLFLRGSYKSSAQMLCFKSCLPAISNSIQLNISQTKTSSEEAFQRKYGGERSFLLCPHLSPCGSCNITSSRFWGPAALWMHQPLRWDFQGIQVTEQYRNQTMVTTKGWVFTLVPPTKVWNWSRPTEKND